MKLRDAVSGFLLARRVIQAIERLAAAQEAQNVLLTRLADVLAPTIPVPTIEELRRQTGVSYTRDEEQARLEVWRADFESKIGRPVTDAEVDEYLREAEEGYHR